jgi:hypothetical protein
MGSLEDHVCERRSISHWRRVYSKGKRVYSPRFGSSVTMNLEGLVSASATSLHLVDWGNDQATAAADHAGDCCHVSAAG